MIHMLAVFFPALFIGSVFSAFAGGGLGIVMLIVGSFFFPVQQNIAIIATLLLGIQFSKLFHFHTHVRWPVVGWYVLLGIPASFIGGHLLFLMPSAIIGRVLGCVLLLTAVKDCFPAFRMTVKPTPRMLVVSGAVNGMVGGIIGNAGVIRAQVLLAIGLSKAEFIGTSTAIALPMNIAKSAAYVPYIPWSRETIALFIFGVPLMLCGVWIGKKLLVHIHSHIFEALQRGIIILGAVRFLLF